LLSSESLELKSMASWMGVPAVRVKGNGAVVIMTEDAESAGVREQGEVVAVLVAQVLVPSESEEPVLLRTLTWGFAKVMVMPEYVPAGALVLARSELTVWRSDRFTVTGLESSETLPSFPVEDCRDTPVI